MTLPQRISLTSAILAVVTIIVCYLIAVEYGSVPACIPLFAGCAPITATGVTYPEAYFFRGGLISAAVFIIVWWYCMRAYLKIVREQQLGFWLKMLFSSSVLASVLLIISVLVLGPHMSDSKATKGLWQLHTITAVLFFLITTINQIGVTWWLKRSVTEGHGAYSTLKLKQAINVLQILFLAWLFTNFISELSREAVNIIEWWLALLSSIYFLSGYWDWKEFRLARDEI